MGLASESPQGGRVLPWKAKAQKDRRRWFLENFVIAFGNRGSLIVLIYIVIFAPILITKLLSKQLNDTGQTTLMNLLGTQVQILATILGLVISTTFVVAELASRYSQRILHRVLGPWTFYYIGPYLVALGLSLFAMSGRFFPQSAWVSLFLDGLCLGLLVPYLMTLRKRLSVHDLVHEIQLDVYKNPEKCDECFSELLSIASGAIDLADWPIFAEVLGCFEEVCGELIRLGYEEQLATLYNWLRDTALCYFSSPWVPFQIINTVKQLGGVAASCRCAEEVKENHLIKLLGIQKKIALESIRRHFNDRAEYATGALGFMAQEAVKTKLWEAAKDAIVSLIWLQEEALKSGVEEALNMSRSALQGILIVTVQQGQDESSMKLVKLCFRKLRRVGQNFYRRGLGESYASIIETICSLVTSIANSKKGLNARYVRYVMVEVLENVKWMIGRRNNSDHLARAIHDILEKTWNAFFGEKREFWQKVLEMGVTVEELTRFVANQSSIAFKMQDWKAIRKIVITSGLICSNVLDAGDLTRGENIFHLVEKIANKLLQIQNIIPLEEWTKQRLMWQLAAALHHITIRAAKIELANVAEKGQKMLMELGQAAAARKEYYDTSQKCIEGLKKIVAAKKLNR